MIIKTLNTDKKYRVIYADPPWKFSNRKVGGSLKSGAASQYDVMDINDIAALPVDRITHDNCLLVMWYVGSMPKEAIYLCEAWGFTVKNINGFVWEKETVHGKPFFGMGFFTRAVIESAIIATKGKSSDLVVNHSVRAVRKAKIGRHSEKPTEFRDDIVKLAGDVPRLEMFARVDSPGWDCWGNEL
jgi:N6-adenosine-specific RNA methylase IME4